MKKGFTIIELLVASLLLGMLTTILTMVFNQSSIAWRTGVAGVADLDDVRDNIAELREEADNSFVWNDEVRRITGLWDRNGDLFDRACDAPGSRVYSADNGRWRANMLETRKSVLSSAARKAWTKSQNVFVVGQGSGGRTFRTYTVNVMSAGPDREFGTWDDVWSWPDDFE